MDVAFTLSLVLCTFSVEKLWQLMITVYIVLSSVFQSFHVTISSIAGTSVWVSFFPVDLLQTSQQYYSTQDWNLFVYCHYQHCGSLLIHTRQTDKHLGHPLKEIQIKHNTHLFQFMCSYWRWYLAHDLQCVCQVTVLLSLLVLYELCSVSVSVHNTSVLHSYTEREREYFLSNSIISRQNFNFNVDLHWRCSLMLSVKGYHRLSFIKRLINNEST